MINEDVKIKIGSQPKEDLKKETSAVTMSLNVRRTLDGNIMIFDHKELDIVIMPEKRKVIAFPKDTMDDTVYESQDRLFKHLTAAGVINSETIQGGNIFMSMEAKVPTSEDYNDTQMVLFSIGKFIEEEKPYFEYERAYDEYFEKRLTEPGPGESTEFDPARHAAEKGSVRKSLKPYGIASIYII